MKRNKCEECNGNIIRKKVDYIYLGENLGKFDAEVREKCSEIVFDKDVTKQVYEIAKRRGIYGLSSKAKISQVAKK